MTREDAIYCLKSYQPDAPDDMCQKCKYFQSVKLSPNVYTCISDKARDMAIQALSQEPTIGHCKECKYFVYDQMLRVEALRVPVIVAHEVCTRWGAGEGCQTIEDGYCFLFEPRESEA